MYRRSEIHTSTSRGYIYSPICVVHEIDEQQVIAYKASIRNTDPIYSTHMDLTRTNITASMLAGTMATTSMRVHVIRHQVPPIRHLHNTHRARTAQKTVAVIDHACYQKAEIRERWLDCLVPDLQDAVPWAGSDCHAIFSHSEATHPVIVTRQHACQSNVSDKMPDWQRHKFKFVVHLFLDQFLHVVFLFSYKISKS